MEVLYLIEKIRTPILDTFLSTITHLGEETFFILLGLIFFWCVNKKEGYYLLSIGFIGTILNQFLKLLFRIPRPWVKDKNFTIVESARGEATGYSFPSGHTQSSVGIFGALARWHSQRAIRIIGIILCILIPFSRLYLGVHTPLDVGVSIGIALVLIFGLYPVIHKCFENKKAMRILLWVIFGLAVIFWAFVTFYNFPENVDSNNLASGTKNAYKMLGCTLGILVSFEIDDRFIKFETDGNFLCQVLKFIIGLIPLLLIKEGMRYPLGFIFGGSYVADGVRYLLIVLFAGCIWPLTFKFFKKLTQKNKTA